MEQPDGASSYRDFVQEDERIFTEAIPRSGQLTTAPAPYDDASTYDGVNIEGGMKPSSGQFSTAEESATDTDAKGTCKRYKMTAITASTATTGTRVRVSRQAKPFGVQSRNFFLQVLVVSVSHTWFLYIFRFIKKIY